MKTIIYHNLTQCSGRRNIYLRSTDIEQKNWHRLLWSIPDELLFFLYKNKKIVIKDITSNNRSKIKYIFYPVFIDFLNHIYFKREPKHKYLKKHFELAIKSLKEDKSLSTKYLFWEGLILNIDFTVKVKKLPKELNPI